VGAEVTVDDVLARVLEGKVLALERGLHLGLLSLADVLAECRELLERGDCPEDLRVRVQALQLRARGGPVN